MESLLIDVSLLGEVFCLACDKHSTVESIAADAYQQYCMCFPEESSNKDQMVLFTKDQRGRIINGRLRVLELSTERKFDVVMGPKPKIPDGVGGLGRGTSKTISSQSQFDNPAVYGTNDVFPSENEEQLVEVKIYDETFLILVDKDTTVSSMATKAYEEYRISFPEAVMKRILLVRDNTGRVVSGELKVQRLPGNTPCYTHCHPPYQHNFRCSQSSAHNHVTLSLSCCPLSHVNPSLALMLPPGDHRIKFDVVVDEHPWTEEILPIETIESAYRNWQLTTAQSIASLVYHTCTAPSMNAASVFDVATATATAGGGSSNAGVTESSSSSPSSMSMTTTDQLLRIRAALDVIRELQYSTSLPVQVPSSPLVSPTLSTVLR